MLYRIDRDSQRIYVAGSVLSFLGISENFTLIIFISTDVYKLNKNGTKNQSNKWFPFVEIIDSIEPVANWSPDLTELSNAVEAKFCYVWKVFLINIILHKIIMNTDDRKPLKELLNLAAL